MKSTSRILVLKRQMVEWFRRTTDGPMAEMRAMFSNCVGQSGSSFGFDVRYDHDWRGATL